MNGNDKLMAAIPMKLEPFDPHVTNYLEPYALGFIRKRAQMASEAYLKETGTHDLMFMVYGVNPALPDTGLVAHVLISKQVLNMGLQKITEVVMTSCEHLTPFCVVSCGIVDYDGRDSVYCSIEHVFGDDRSVAEIKKNKDDYSLKEWVDLWGKKPLVKDLCNLLTTESEYYNGLHVDTV